VLRGTITFRGDAEATAKDLKAAVKEALLATGRTWHTTMLGKHFAANAVQRYRYKSRSRKYRERKERRFGHQLPLVFSGNLRRLVTRQAKLSSTSKGARVGLTGPRYLYAYRKDFAQPDKAKELTAITPGEVRELAQLLDTLVTTRLNTNRETRTRRF